ncbi:MAG: type IV secretion system protein TraC [Azonexus sp.]|nr:type IV secretion system protein TraC [Azonexus sp.]
MSFNTVLNTLLGEQMAGRLSSLFGGAPSSVTDDDPEFQRDPGRFSSWLNYRAYDAEEKIFVLTDGIGCVLECLPQSGADQSMVDLLRGVYTAPWPKGASLQFSLFGTPHIKPLLRQYANQRLLDDDHLEQTANWGRHARNGNLYRMLARRRVEHYLNGSVESVAKTGNYLLRDFRLAVSIYIPGKISDPNAVERLTSLRAAISGTLGSSGFPSRQWDAEDLINWSADFCNPHRLHDSDAPRLHYDPYRQLRDQIVDIDTRQRATEHELLFRKPSRDEVISAQFFVAKSYPENAALWKMGALIGDSLQNTLQYPCPFLITMGVQFQDASEVKTLVAANQIRATQNAESQMAKLMPDLAEKKRDWDQALKDVGETGILVRLFHSIGIFPIQEEADRAGSITEGIWREAGFALSNITFLHRPALMSALPLGFTKPMQEALYSMGISSTKSVANATHLSPMFGEWRGSRSPVMLFGGRRGQVIGLDLYDNKEGNYNFAIGGSSGSGKSVFLNEIAWSYLGTGAKVWMLDLGNSFARLCQKADGQKIELEAGCGLNINPFTHIVDFNDDMAMLQAVVAKMAAPYGDLEPFQYAAIATALTRCWAEKGKDMTITDIRNVFVVGKLNPEDPHDTRLTDLAVMLAPYATGGAYAEFFDGPSNVDFARQLIVIEVEALKRSPQLHRVVMMILLFRITSEMYFTRNKRKLLIIDELKQQLGNDNDKVVELIIEEAARRARKYGGALGTATQMLDDYYESPALTAAFNLSDAIFILRQRKEAIELLSKTGRLSVDEHKKRLLQTLRLEEGAYSEVYAFTTMGEGVLRVIIDPATLLLFSNRHEDNAPLDEKVARGLSIDEAIEELLRERGVIR